MHFFTFPVRCTGMIAGDSTYYARVRKALIKTEIDIALYLQLLYAFVRYGNGTIIQGAWQRDSGSFWLRGLLCLCQSPGPGRKWLCVAWASNILAGT